MELGGYGALGWSFGHVLLRISAGLGNAALLSILFCFCLILQRASPLVRHSFARLELFSLYKSLASTSLLVLRDAYPVR